MHVKPYCTANSGILPGALFMICSAKVATIPEPVGCRIMDNGELVRFLVLSNVQEQCSEVSATGLPFGS